MSINILLENTHNNQEVYIPVSGETFFSDAWRPLAADNNLELIVSMQYGYSIDQTILKKLIVELKTLKECAFKAEYLNAETRSYLKEKIEHIINEIEPEVDFPSVKGFV